MGLTRVSEQDLQRRKDEIVRIKKEINEHEAVLKEKDSPLWLRLGPAIKNSIEANREKMEELLARGSIEIDAHGNKIAVDPVADLASAKMIAGAIAFGKNILSEVEVEATIELKRNRVARLTEELKKIQEEQGV